MLKISAKIMEFEFIKESGKYRVETLKDKSYRKVIQKLGNA